MGWHFVGLDLGQSRDFTAVVVLERAELTGEWDPVMVAWKKTVRLRLRYLERMALGTTYPEMVERVVTVTRSPELAGRCHVIADGTGVGRPVIDLLRKSGLACQLLPVIITGGDMESSEQGWYRVPKKDLISGLQVLLQRGGLQIAAGLELGPTLEQELGDMEVRTTATGREQYGAWRTGQHDDLVLALALACWGARKMYPNPPAGEEGYWRRPLEKPFTTETRRTRSTLPWIMQDGEITHLAIGAALEVHRALGPGLLESAYQRCLCRELEMRKVRFAREVALPVVYKGFQIDCSYRIDLLIEELVVVEVKAVETVLPIHVAQALTYLRLGNWKVGLLINFNVPVLKMGIRRLIL